MVKGIGNKVKEAIDSLTIAHITFLKEIKYFHPQGKEMPNGCHYQRGGFLNECKTNSESFMPSAAHNNLKGQNGGILVFPIDVDSQIVNGIHDYINNLNGTIKDTQKRITTYCIGNHFKGRYVRHQGEIYDSNSLSLEIGGKSSKQLLTYAMMLVCKKQMQVLVKDLNTNKIYVTRLSNSKP